MDRRHGGGRVDFWEYTCISWIRTSPYVKAWHRDYADHGLVVIGVHAPEFEFGTAAWPPPCCSSRPSAAAGRPPSFLRLSR